MLRQDKTAQERLYMLRVLDKLLDQPATRELFMDLPGLPKTVFCNRFDCNAVFVQNIIQKRTDYEQFVAKSRIGVHGLRPFGSNQHWAEVGSRAQGSRLRGPVSVKQQPLKFVFQRIRKWFFRERKYGHEVKNHQLISRLNLELRTEIGRQQVLQSLGSNDFKAKTLAAAQHRLNKLATGQRLSKATSEWFRKHYYPAIGARARKGQKQSHQDDKFDPMLAKLTWASMDYAMYLTHSGDHEELGQLVADPMGFQDNGKKTVIVGLDQTPVWLRLRGESKVMVTSDEVEARSTRRRLSRKTKDSEGLLANEALAKLIQHLHDNPDMKLQTSQMVSQGGDKYRLTLITFQAIQGWLDPDVWPYGEMPKHILLVPCKHHARLENIDQEGNWIESVFQNRNLITKDLRQRKDADDADPLILAAGLNRKYINTVYIYIYT